MTTTFIFDRNGKYAAASTQLEDSRCIYSGKTIDEMVNDNTISNDYVVCDFKSLVYLCRERARKLYCKGASEITAERFHELLNVLPPMRWESFPGGELFMVPECISGSIYQFCVRIGERYYTINESCDAKTDDLIRACMF